MSRVPPAVWDAVRGDSGDLTSAGLAWTPREALPDLADLALPDATREAVARAPDALTDGQGWTLVVRGPAGGGRTAALGAVARAAGCGLLVSSGPDPGLLGPLAALTGAMPVRKLAPVAGEAVALPTLAGFAGPRGVVLGPRGGLAGPEADAALFVTLPAPGPVERRQIWSIGLAEAGAVCRPDDLDAIAAGHRLARGHARRAAARAAALPGSTGGWALPPTTRPGPPGRSAENDWKDWPRGSIWAGRGTSRCSRPPEPAGLRRPRRPVPAAG